MLPDNLSYTKLLRFQDYFDLELWNELCSDSKLMPLISWEIFLYAKSKHLIVAVILLDTEHKRDAERTKIFVTQYIVFLRK